MSPRQLLAVETLAQLIALWLDGNYPVAFATGEISGSELPQKLES